MVENLDNVMYSVRVFLRISVVNARIKVSRYTGGPNTRSRVIIRASALDHTLCVPVCPTYKRYGHDR